MAKATAIKAVPCHAKYGYKFTVAIEYANGEVFHLCGAVSKDSALDIGKRWIAAQEKGDSTLNGLYRRT
jgi:hypothetical protein